MSEDQKNFKFENLKITLPEPRWRVPKFGEEELLFGRQFADIMVVIDYDEEKGGWGIPEIMPHGNFSLSPACPCFHYGSGCFEGMKAYRSGNTVRFFRPFKNMTRMNGSIHRICLPTFPEKEFMKIIAKAVSLVKDWVPDIPDMSLYVRPTMIGTEPAIGVKPSKNARLFVLFCPVGGYYSGKCHLLVDRRYLRAFKGGTGKWKLGGNYAPTILPQKEAKAKGFNQLLWVSPEGNIQEVGTMNFFKAVKSKDSDEVVIVTAPISSGTILPGVTRESIIEILRKWGYKVEERAHTMDELIEEFNEKRVVEVFGTGTAAVVCPVYSLSISKEDGSVGEKMVFPVPEDGVGARAKAELIKIQRGVSEEFQEFAVKLEDVLKE